MEWKRTEREEQDYNEIKKFIKEIPCSAHFSSDRDSLVTSDSSRAGVVTTLWQKQTGNTIQPIASVSRCLIDAGKNYPIGGLEKIAVVWGLGKFRCY